MVMPRSRYEVTFGNAVLLMLNCLTVQSLPMHKTPHLLTETDNCHSSAHVTRAASASCSTVHKHNHGPKSGGDEARPEARRAESGGGVLGEGAASPLPTS